ncbi:response regulator [Paraburkholderia dipogonis]|nr:response regulator [Paraburkholderia dipogonis]
MRISSSLRTASKQLLIGASSAYLQAKFCSAARSQAQHLTHRLDRQEDTAIQPGSLSRLAPQNPQGPVQPNISGISIMSRVLLVDDQPEALSALRAVLVGRGYTVATAADGAEAFERLQRTRVSAVVCDWRMPNMDGAELIESMQARSELASVPVILTSGSGEAPAFPVKGFLRKPFALDKLLSLLAECESDAAMPAVC